MNHKIINLAVTDNKIWDRDKKIIEIVGALLASPTGTVVIQLTNLTKEKVDGSLEGPCAEVIGLYAMLDEITKTFNIDRQRITIRTKNLKERHPDYRISILRRVKGKLNPELTKMFRDQIELTKDKNFDINFKHFGCFLNRSNWQRLWIASHLYAFHNDKSYMSYNYSLKSDYHLNFLGVDELFKKVGDHSLVNQTFHLISNSPLNLDKIEVYPPSPSYSMEHLAEYYNKIFLEVVCETFFEGNVFTITEKTIRPILLKTPFIIQGPPNYLKNLKKLGFKTFDKWWDEVYNDASALPKDQELTWSTKKILTLLDNIAKLPVSHLEQLYHDMKPTLEYNLNLWLDYNNEKINSLTFE